MKTNVYDVNIRITRRNGKREKRSHLVQETSINKAVARMRRGFCRPSDIANSVSAYLIQKDTTLGEYLRNNNVPPESDHAQTGQPATERE